MTTHVLIGARARRELIVPLQRAVRAINASLGPGGRALLYEASPGGVGFANDGLTIAREMAESEGIRSIGPRILKETLFAAQRDLGDGSARLACILGAILAEGAKLVTAGYPPQELADAILASAQLVRQRLVNQRRTCTDLRSMAAAVVAEPALVDAVDKAVQHAGADGVVDVADHPRDGCHIEVGEGFAVDAALVSEHLGPAAPATVLELDNVFVLAVNEIVSDFGPLTSILEAFASRRKALAIVARDVTGIALEGLVRNRREIGLHVVALKPTDVSLRGGELLEDLAIATGATLVGAELGRNMDSVRPTMLGRAKKMRFAKSKALFIDPGGDRSMIEQRRVWLSREAERVRYLAYDREHALRRSARLAGRWTRVHVGGRSSHEVSARVAECTAAVATLQAGLQSGIVAGGGSAFVREAARLRTDTPSGTGIDRAAAVCMARGLEAVATHIARNAGIDPNGFMERLREPAGSEIGFDARTGRVGNVIVTGIADPFSITAGVIGRAASVAATLLRTEALICR